MIHIGILIHENEHNFVSRNYLINALIDIWKNSGNTVTVIKGTKSKPKVDLLIPHIDLTKMPERYCDFMSSYANVVNRNVTDISKKRISSNLLNKESVYSGRIIVKPNLNAGGIGEFLSLFPIRNSRIRNMVLRYRERFTKPYRLYNSMDELPGKYFSDKNFVVEKFLPEKEGDVYLLRVFSFLGDRFVNSRVGSLEKIVKRKNIFSRELVTVPDEILRLKEHFEFGYGKFDYVIHNGEPVLFDTNKTPGYASYNLENAKVLAAGIKFFL